MKFRELMGRNFTQGDGIFLLNSATFLILSLVAKIFSFEPLFLVLFPSTLFFIGSAALFVHRVVSGRILEPSTGFIVGAGAYFGFGVVTGGLHVHPYSAETYGTDTSYLMDVNLLNSASIFIVTFICILVNILSTHSSIEKRSEINIVYLRKYTPHCFAALGLVQIVTLADVLFFDFSILTQSMIAKLDYISISIFLVAGLIWRNCSQFIKILFLFLLSNDIIFGFIEMSKFRMLDAIFAILFGYCANGVSWRLATSALSLPVLVFIVINPLVTITRMHYQFYAAVGESYNINDFLDIPRELLDPNGRIVVLQGDRGLSFDLQNVFSMKEQLASVGRRFDVASIQGFLISEYNNGRPGETLSNFWQAFIPRVIWPDKPIMTNIAVDLHRMYYNDQSQTSAAAPTFSGEAYWNYGWSGVAIVSFFIGLVIGVFDCMCRWSLTGHFPEYYIIAIPAFIWAAFVESWLIISYLGQFVIIIALLALCLVVTKLVKVTRSKFIS